MSQNGASKPRKSDLNQGDQSSFEVLRTYEDIPATAFISSPGALYYQLDSKDLPRPAPFTQFVTLTIELRGLRSIPQDQNDPVVEILRELRYTSNRGVTGVFELSGSRDGSPFLRGNVYFFRYDFNPDPGQDGVPVHRTVALGLRPQRRNPKAPGWGDFGFLREIDTFGRGFPAISNREADFQIFTSPAAFHDSQQPNGPFLAKDLTLSAGDLSSLG